MIITARAARNLANNFPKSEVRQLRKIENAIIRIARKGNNFIEYRGVLYHSVILVLEKNGYKVEDRCTYNYYRFVISWNKKS